MGTVLNQSAGSSGNSAVVRLRCPCCKKWFEGGTVAFSPPDRCWHYAAVGTVDPHYLDGDPA